MALSAEALFNQRFLPSWRFAFNNKGFQYDKWRLTDKLKEIEIIKKPKGRAQKLMFRLGEHHLDTLYHSFEVGIIAYKLARYYYKGPEEVTEPSLKKIFVAGLLHDIGKLGVDEEILKRTKTLEQDQKTELIKHGRIGEIILEELDLREFIPFAGEHHVGNSGMNHWTKKQLDSRHPLVEFVSLADLLAASLDARRKYKKPKTIEEIIKEVQIKTKKGIFSPALEQAFFKFVLENELPPFSDEAIRKDKMIRWFFDVK